jgi:hypothetical protein
MELFTNDLGQGNVEYPLFGFHKLCKCPHDVGGVSKYICMCEDPHTCAGVLAVAKDMAEAAQS